MKIIYYNKYLFFILFFCLLACKKKSNNATSNFFGARIGTFTWTGVRIVGDTIKFVSTASAGDTYLWDFGDSTTSSLQAPYHIYTHSGSFTVQLYVNGKDSGSLAIIIYNDPIYTRFIAGIRNYHYIYSFIGVPGLRDSAYAKPDTMFSIQYIDQLTVAAGNDTLFYTGSDSASGPAGYHEVVFGADIKYNNDSSENESVIFDYYNPDSSTVAFRKDIYGNNGSVHGYLFYTW